MGEKIYGLLGRKLGHSWSVPIHEELGRKGYRLIELEPEELAPFLAREDIVADLDNYTDYIHCSGEADQLVLEKIAAGECQLTEENLEETLANWREFVVHYDYDQFWDERFWIQWNAEHAAAP